MIDEKKLIEDIKNLIDSEELAGHSPGSVLHSVCEKVWEQPKACEWIPVSERRPRELIDVLVTVQDIQNGDDMLVMIGNYKDWWQVYDIDGTEQSKARVFAWQPLPEPYREEVQNDEL